MLLLVDNHDSFTWNLVELLRRNSKVSFKIRMPEQLGMDEIDRFDRIIFSPGPGLPEEQPVMYEIIKKIVEIHTNNGKKIPVFGVCLGMQAIAQFFGGRLMNLPQVVHGQPRGLKIMKPEYCLFKGIPDNTPVGLYHSWAVDPSTLPESLKIIARSDDGTIMGLAHQLLPICGVQFHPESVMTPEGARMLKNWLYTASYKKI